MVTQRSIALTAPLLQRAIYDKYAESVGLDPKASYIHGTPLRPVVPLDVGAGSVFILGAYPSARFALIDGISDVPVADNLGPLAAGETLQIGGLSIPTIHCAHPGILMRRQPDNPWPDRHRDAFIPAIREHPAATSEAAPPLQVVANGTKSQLIDVP